MKGFLIGLAVLQSVLPVSATAQSLPGNVVSPDSLALARTIVRQLHVEQTTVFAIDKLAPVFASQVLATTDKMPDAQNPFSAIIATDGGRERASKALSEAYKDAFTLHISELGDVVANKYAALLSIDDLKSLTAFLATPAGMHWADAATVFQASASDEGQRIGSIAGAEAVSVALKKLGASGAAK